MKADLSPRAHVAGSRVHSSRSLKNLSIEIAVRACSAAQKLLAFLPTQTVLAMAAAIGGFVFRFCSREERTSIAQLRYAFPEGLPNRAHPAGDEAAYDQELREIARSAFRHVGRGMGEAILCKKFLRGNRKVHTREQIVGEGGQLIESLRQSGSGAVGLSAHLGSFELLGAYLADCGLKCSVLGRSPNYGAVESAMRRLRRSYGVEVIWTDCADATRHIIAAAKGGRVICALIDQDTRWSSEFSPFFGLDAASPIAPIQLAIRYQLPLFTSFIVRTSPTSHLVTTESIPYSADDTQVNASVLKTYNERLETFIRRYPDQYIWWHRRWRRRPGINYIESPALLRGYSA